MRSVLKAALVLAVVAVWGFGLVGVAGAQTGPTGPGEPSDERHFGFTGTIKGAPVAAAGSPSSGSFILTLERKGGDVTGDVKISVDAATKFKVPGDKSVTLANYTTRFADGDRVAVLANPKVGDAYPAVHVNKIPCKGPSHSQRQGTITAYSVDGAGSESITLQPKKGDLVTYTWTAGAGAPKISVKKGATTPYTDGERAVVTLKRDPSSCQFNVKQVQIFRAKGKP